MNLFTNISACSDTGNVVYDELSFWLEFSGILVCTDVMGRGIDIPDISWVIQYDPPTHARFTAFFCIFAISI